MLKRVLLTVAILMAVLSCQSDYDTELVNQESYIDSYITQNYPDNEVVRNGGSNRIVIKSGSGSQIEEGDIVSFTYVGYIFESGGPTETFTGNTVSGITVGDGDVIKGLDLGLVGMKRGEQSIILFTAKYGYGRGAVNVVPEASALLFTVTVNSISKQDK